MKYSAQDDNDAFGVFFEQKIFGREKLRGRFRVPGLLLADTSLSASFSSLPFSWLPWFYSPFHFSWTTIATVVCCNLLNV
jgi:hypothetical protein